MIFPISVVSELTASRSGSNSSFMIGAIAARPASTSDSISAADPNQGRRHVERFSRRTAATTAYSLFAFVVADAFDSYDVFVDSKKFTSWRVSLAAAIHLAGFDTL